MIKTVGYAAQGPPTPLEAFRFERREPGENDVRIEILHCGVCHSDLHIARYPRISAPLARSYMPAAPLPTTR
jgi:D-arabinose 1-dehydrogenase-like Zn-dependent alcohol dehydrogenase